MTDPVTTLTDKRDRNGEANSLNNLGSAYHFLGEYQIAIDYHQLLSLID